MNVILKGSSPATLVAGILLLSRARSFGQRMAVGILGDPTDIGVVHGPALVASVPLASCGVGRDYGSGATVIVPGPAAEPLAVSLAPNGAGDWFCVDRGGQGVHPATRAFLALRRDTRTRARWLGQQLLRALELSGSTADPAVLDILFGAPVAPLTRLGVALRAGRSLSGARGEPITRWLSEHPLPDGATPLERLRPESREAVEACLRSAESLSAEDGGRYRPLQDAVVELLTHLAMLPPFSILSPLDPTLDAVAFGLGKALTATEGGSEAQQGLVDTYRFLGGKFTDSAMHPVCLPDDLPPTDRLLRWRWFCLQTDTAAKRVDRLWRDVVDPPQ